MNRLPMVALLTNLVDRMRGCGSWCGETHIQKSVYVAQTLAEVPIGFDFILYKHGPFSFDLRDELTSMRADGLLRLEPQQFPYGPKFQATEIAHGLQQRFPKTLGKHRDRLEFVANKLARKPVDELERVATALFATVKLPSADSHERATWINAKKPHVSLREALEALAEVKSLIHQYSTWGGLANEVRYWGNWVLERVRKEIGDLYPLIPDPEYQKGKTPHAKGKPKATKALLSTDEDDDDESGDVDVPPGYLFPIA